MAEELPPTASPSPKSTRSARSATIGVIRALAHASISIHALRKERDSSCNAHARGKQHFNPRAPQGARLGPGFRCYFGQYFNPRAPQGARPGLHNLPRLAIIFQSTRSARSATRSMRSSSSNHIFQSTRSARSATRSFFHSIQNAKFQSTRSARSATFILSFIYSMSVFQSTRSARSATQRLESL